MDHNNNIPNEDKDLNGLAPGLSKLKVVDPTGPSDSYFDSFNAKLQNRINDLEEIEAMAPTLLNISKYNPFEVPADYFDELPTIVQEKVTSARSKIPVAEWLLLLIKPRFIIPFATTIIIAVAGINYMNRNSGTLQPVYEEDLSLEEQLYYIDEAAIIEQYTANTASESETTSETGIEDYLIDNNVEETDL
ncbi:MAG: hypothetical protein H0X46_08865 [Bacteroidetes bacterium]|nr:hypothetical protein [Bacteroidota bacterium]